MFTVRSFFFVLVKKKKHEMVPLLLFFENKYLQQIESRIKLIDNLVILPCFIQLHYYHDFYAQKCSWIWWNMPNPIKNYILKSLFSLQTLNTDQLNEVQSLTIEERRILMWSIQKWFFYCWKWTLKIFIEKKKNYKYCVTDKHFVIRWLFILFNF